MTQVLTGEVARLTAALEQAQRDAAGASQAQTEAEELTGQVGRYGPQAPRSAQGVLRVRGYRGGGADWTGGALRSAGVTVWCD
jgi:hypothetical protein